MYVPKGTPKVIVDKLAAALNQALDDPAVAKRILDLGGSVPGKRERGPSNLAAVLQADIAKWHPILKNATVE
jgi:tripartite-type tricarboxylate transporter receptor subunit TctC